MADIFISYARADRERAQALASALGREGWSVWWDRDIPPGRTFDDVIEEALGAAKCVIVLWSADSVRSEWVKNEASDAAHRRILVPVLVEQVTPPLEFRRIQSAALLDWANLPANPDWSHLCKSLDSLAERQPSSIAHDAPARVERPAAPDRAARTPVRRSSTAAIAAAGVLVVVAGVAWAVLSRPFSHAPSRAAEPTAAPAPPPDRRSEPAGGEPNEPAVPAAPAGAAVSPGGTDVPRAGGGRQPRAPRDATSAAPVQPGRAGSDLTRDTVRSAPAPGASVRIDRREATPADLPARAISIVPSEAPTAGASSAPARTAGATVFEVAYTRGVFRESGRLTTSSDGLRYAEANGRSAIDAACGDVRRVQVPTVIVDAAQRMVELQMRDRVLRFTLADTAARNGLVSALSQACGTR